MVFDVNMDFTRKHRYIATRYYAPKYNERRYTGVVLFDIFCIAFTYAFFNGIDTMTADKHSSYLAAPYYEKYWTRCGHKFGSEYDGEKAIIFEVLMDSLVM